MWINYLIIFFKYLFLINKREKNQAKYIAIVAIKFFERIRFCVNEKIMNYKCSHRKLTWKVISVNENFVYMYIL